MEKYGIKRAVVCLVQELVISYNSCKAWMFWESALGNTGSLELGFDSGWNRSVSHRDD